MIFFKLHVSPNTYHNCHNAKKGHQGLNVYFRNELELVCLVIGWGGGGLRLFIWGGRGYRVDASRKLGSYIFHWFREIL